MDKFAVQNFFKAEDIKACMKKVRTVNLHEVVQVDDELQIKAYYAGHVLGAAMFEVRVGQQSFVYTGDYNMTPDRHLGAAWIDKCRPDILITESTYATTIRDSKRCRERDFIKNSYLFRQRRKSSYSSFCSWKSSRIVYFIRDLLGKNAATISNLFLFGSNGKSE